MAVIGAGGSMGGIIARGFLSRGILEPDQLIVSGRDGRKLEALEKMGARITDLRSAAREADALLIAVKPADIGQVGKQISGCCDGKLLVSTAAGTPHACLSQTFEGAQIVRAMPNIACDSGEGLTFLHSNILHLNMGYRLEVTRWFEGMGRVEWAASERSLDVSTGANASAIAYGFKLVEVIERQAIRHGLNALNARQFACQVVRGAAAYAESHMGRAIDELVRDVASKGGTTEAGLARAEELGVWAALEQVIAEAIQKSLAMVEEAKEKLDAKAEA